jgi:hypothetical protein
VLNNDSKGGFVDLVLLSKSGWRNPGACGFFVWQAA